MKIVLPGVFLRDADLGSEHQPKIADLNPASLTDTIGWALATWYQRPAHIAAMRTRAMAQDFSWQRAAAAYHDLYHAAYERRRGHPFAD